MIGIKNALPVKRSFITTEVLSLPIWFTRVPLTAVSQIPNRFPGRFS